MKAIALHSIIPLRAEALEAAEQLTQMLFAETCEILEQKPRWNRVKLDLDGQTGWVDAKMLSPLSDKEFVALQKAFRHSAIVKMPMAYAVSENNSQTIPLTAGTRLPQYSDGTFNLLGVTFRIDPAMVSTAAPKLTQDNLLKVVRFFLNTPYLWGGKNAMGMDCSGFTQTIHAIFGHSLLRNASEQATQGTAVPLDEAQAGDLAFFDHADIDPTATHISHVGILIDKERIIHCSGRVKVEKLDKQGIFSTEQADKEQPKGRYTHHLVTIRHY